MGKNEIRRAIEDLGAALADHGEKSKKPGAERLAYLALTKAFEVALEYLWKDIKKKAEAEGLEPQSPKNALRDGMKLGLIKTSDDWFRFVDARNIAVHDYYGITKKGFIELAKSLYTLLGDYSI